MVEVEPGLILANAAAAKEELMGAVYSVLALDKQNVAAGTIFHLAMDALKRKLGARWGAFFGRYTVGLSFKQHAGGAI